MMSDQATQAAQRESVPAGMLPPWTVGDLPPPPPGGWRRWLNVVGPGVLLAGASIGSGEWLSGPAVTAQYGGTLLWLATLSIVGQVFVNLGMLRYTVFCGEPINVGFFRSWPGPWLWTFCYAALDFAAIWPFNVANAAVALAAALLGRLPTPGVEVGVLGLSLTEDVLVKLLSYVLFLTAFLPLIFGGTIYKMLLRIFTFKLVLVLLYLGFFAVFMVSGRNAAEIATGFVRFGQVPLRADTVIAGRHFTLMLRDNAGSYQVRGTVENNQAVIIRFTVNRDGQEKTYGAGADLPTDLKRKREVLATEARRLAQPGQFFVQDSKSGTTLTVAGTIEPGGDWHPAQVTIAGDGSTQTYDRLDDVPPPYRDRARELVDNQGLERVGLFGYWREHGHAPKLDWGIIAVLAAIAGAGGLSNTLYSSFARDKGWGMSANVGAIPSLVGGKTIALSHVGEVFRSDETNRSRWRGWLKYVLEDQIVVWMLCQFLGMALPCMLSLEFIRHAPVEGNRVAAMTAEGMAHRYPGAGQLLWLVTLAVAFLILFPGQILSADQLARRWTDIIWSSNPQAQRLHGTQVKYVYYGILLLYAVWGLAALALFDPLLILKIGGVLLNVAMGFSALHTLYVNRSLMPRDLWPNRLMQVGMACCGVFFLGLTVVVLLNL